MMYNSVIYLCQDKANLGLVGFYVGISVILSYVKYQ